METGGSKDFMRPKDKLEGSGDGGVWMKTGIFQSNAGLTRCIGNLIAPVRVSPVGQSEAQAPHLELQMGTANPSAKASLRLHPFACINIRGVHGLWRPVLQLL